MLHILGVTLPVFGLIALGFLARGVRLVSDRTGRGLSDFVFSVAVPALILKTLVGAAPAGAQPWGYWLSYFLGVAVVWALAMVLAGRFFGLTGIPAVVAGFAAGQSNTVLVGIPLILEAYGEEGAVPLFLLIAVHLPVTMTIATVLAQGRSTKWTLIARGLALNPILIGIAAGVLLRLSGAPLPGVLRSIVEMLGAAAIPCALFAMGIALWRYGLAASLPLASLLSVLKLLIHPLAVYLLATRVFTMPPVWAGVAVLFAASPCGINAYLFAERYRAGIAVASGAIALSTALSVITTTLWLAVLGVGAR
jgi:predicted permease